MLDICQFTVDITLKSSRLYKSLKNEINLRSGRNQYYQMSDGLYMEHYTKIRILLQNVRTGDLHDIISSTKLDSP